MASAYAAILGRLPRPVAFCFAYGSGVKQQAGRSRRGQVLDLVLAVQRADTWHRDNLLSNRTHYSALGSLGGGALARVQAAAAGLYFNTLLPLPEHQLLYKYGVVTVHQLVQDLQDWRHIYLAGRLHKPVEILVQQTHDDLTVALKSNLSSAVRAALLLLPEKFTEYELYHTISNLSYSGDFRMIFGENKNKVKNIVQPQLESFKELYYSTINAYSDFMHYTDDEFYIQNVTTDAKFIHLSRLPSHPKEVILKSAKRDSDSTPDDVLKFVAQNDSDKILRRSLQSIVWQSSVRQSLKGILTAGILKSLIYSARKIKKMF